MGVRHMGRMGVSERKTIEFWTYGKSGGATFGKRQTKCVFVCFFTHTYTSVMHRRNGRVAVSKLVHMGTHKKRKKKTR